MAQKISISSCFDYDIPLEEQMNHIAKAGFTHISIGSNLEHSKLFEKGRVEEIKNSLIENNLVIDTIHFSQHLTTEDWQPIMEKTMQVSKELCCPVIVAHCTSFMAKEIQGNADIIKLEESIIELVALCEKYNIKVALENLCPGKSTDILEQMLELTASMHIGFCYDSSHDQVDGPRAMTLLEKYKHRLIAMHISDRIKPFTDHVTIDEGFVRFDEMIKILRTIDYNFPFLLEVMKTHSQYKNTEEFLSKAYAGAYKIIQKLK